MDSASTSCGGLLVCADLFFASRITGTAEAAGLRVDVVATMAEALPAIADRAYRCVLIDLGQADLDLDALVAACDRTPRPRIVGFGAHVHAERLAAAKAAGCDDVLPRSRFSSQLPTLLAEWIGT